MYRWIPEENDWLLKSVEHIFSLAYSIFHSFLRYHIKTQVTQSSKSAPEQNAGQNLSQAWLQQLKIIPSH